jgi:heme/copper-type cytochrome/quinol oxidase subunit 3
MRAHSGTSFNIKWSMMVFITVTSFSFANIFATFSALRALENTVDREFIKFNFVNPFLIAEARRVRGGL